jgi:hypothetical protein
MPNNASPDQHLHAWWLQSVHLALSVVIIVIIVVISEHVILLHVNVAGGARLHVAPQVDMESKV